MHKHDITTLGRSWGLCGSVMVLNNPQLPAIVPSIAPGYSTIVKRFWCSGSAYLTRASWAAEIFLTKAFLVRWFQRASLEVPMNIVNSFLRRCATSGRLTPALFAVAVTTFAVQVTAEPLPEGEAVPKT